MTSVVPIDANDIIELRERFQKIEIAKARYEERKAAAEKEIKEAKAKLKEAGFRIATAREEIQESYDDCVAQIEDLEELLDL